MVLNLHGSINPVLQNELCNDDSFHSYKTSVFSIVKAPLTKGRACLLMNAKARWEKTDQCGAADVWEGEDNQSICLLQRCSVLFSSQQNLSQHSRPRHLKYFSSDIYTYVKKTGSGQFITDPLTAAMREMGPGKGLTEIFQVPEIRLIPWQPECWLIRKFILIIIPHTAKSEPGFKNEQEVRTNLQSPLSPIEWYFLSLWAFRLLVHTRSLVHYCLVMMNDESAAIFIHAVYMQFNKLIPSQEIFIYVWWCFYEVVHTRQ